MNLLDETAGLSVGGSKRLKQFGRWGPKGPDWVETAQNQYALSIEPNAQLLPNCRRETTMQTGGVGT
jgi:hypothetical protein